MQQSENIDVPSHYQQRVPDLLHLQSGST